MAPISKQYEYSFSQKQEHQNLLHQIPPASEIYSIVNDTEKPINERWAGAVARVAPLLTTEQLRYLLYLSPRPQSDWPVDVLGRLKYIYELKRRVAMISAGYGGLAHVPQTFLVSIFLGEAFQASLRWSGCGLDPAWQQKLEFIQLMSPADDASKVQQGSREGRVNSSGTDASWTPPRSPAGAALPGSPMMAKIGEKKDRSVSWRHGELTELHLGGSFLGPEEVAHLIRSCLASISQSSIAQKNLRLLLELALAQPPMFLRGVLYELSENGTHRNLAQVLMQLVECPQDAFCSPIDAALLLEEHLGVSIPRRADFMAGGRWARHSYYEDMCTVSQRILDEAEPYLAIRSNVQIRPQSEECLSRNTFSASVESLSRRAVAAIAEADEYARGALKSFQNSGWSLTPRLFRIREDAQDASNPQFERAAELYKEAFTLCQAVVEEDPNTAFGRDWFKAFWQRNHEALMILSVVRNVQQDDDEVRGWLSVQPGASQSTLVQHKWGTGNWDNEQWLVDLIISVLYYFDEDREKLRKDPLVRLLLENPADDRYDFSVVSCMGIVTEGAAGLEMEQAYRRMRERRGVEFVRADTGCRSLEYNSSKIQEAIRQVKTEAWGYIGYSQGCANSLMAESRLCTGTPEQRKLVVGRLKCRNLLYSAANGSAHATCGEWKTTRCIVEAERILKHHQAIFSRAATDSFLRLLWTTLSSREATCLFGGLHSVTHFGARALWRDAQHLPGVPTCTIRSVTEDHTQPESLTLLSNSLTKQIESPLHDTQVALHEAVGHPVYVHNFNAEMLEKCDMGGMVQKASHWAPLDEATEFITTSRDVEKHIFDGPKDRHVYPWIELNARLGLIPKVSQKAENGMKIPPGISRRNSKGGIPRINSFGQADGSARRGRDPRKYAT
eukprot:gnl/MRDRNA2_/MRDRNA2_14673_c0_seq1.p1 gnl/MRDRNA2_/MRDRNA2_14673_c0~~gnl/MRDRNA2_/MRDRNA2_14673_c0_seq1.p1  ORF type:complete len:1041 (+),score=177.80 gnl/MRDRNA2_/MRDRNA2_14673_c0_seq1:429-3125(+)